MQQLGQSAWHDNIHRGLLTGGQMKKMIDAGEITGLTSNPTIFEQAIGKTQDYDEAIVGLAKAGKSAEETFDAIAIEDLKSAAALFRPVYERTKGGDGYVSIEVNPRIANDTQATISEAARLWRAVDMPNLMVKIPATLAGLPAIEKSIADGLNINITLIFSLERYDAVMEAYTAGLIQRAKKGLDLSRIASVASFFVSRVDTAVDPLLDGKAKANPAKAAELLDLQGKAAIANAKLAYEMFQKKFGEPRFADLEKKGARKQRPLWASTSTKNPKYQDVYYVEALLGPDSVDTMPPATIDAYRDHGKPEVRLTRDLDSARLAIEKLAVAGVDMKAVTLKLEVDGVAAFAKSYESLIATVNSRRESISQGKAQVASR
jgi:transaldolase